MKAIIGVIVLVACGEAGAQAQTQTGTRTPVPVPALATPARPVEPGESSWVFKEIQDLALQDSHFTTLRAVITADGMVAKKKPVQAIGGYVFDAEKLLASESAYAPVVVFKKPGTDLLEVAPPSAKLLTRISDKVAPKVPGAWGKVMPLFRTVSVGEKHPELRDEYLAVQRQYLAYARAYVEAVNDPEHKRDQLVQVADGLERAVATAFTATAEVTADKDSDELLRTMLVFMHAQAIEQQSVAGPRSNYELSRYTRLIANAQLVGRIDLADRSIASSVLIGDHLVATAAHAVENFGSGQFRVVFLRNENGSAREYRYKRKGANLLLRPALDVAGVKTKLDFALFEIEPDFTEGDPLVGAETAGLYEGDILRDAGVYVLGYPEKAEGGFSPLVVHDACFAIYPHRVKPGEVDQLVALAVRQKLLADLDLEKILAGGQTIDSTLLRNVYAQKKGSFNALYPSAGTADPDRIYVLPAFEVGPDPLPVFGLDSDTWRGDSGGGVFSKDAKNGSLVGIYVAGQPGNDTQYIPQLKVHQFAVPSSEVASVLRKFPDLIARYHVRIESPFSP